MSESKGSSLLKSYQMLEAFVQCNFLDGFSYIDRAGEIVNFFVRKNKQQPKFQMGLEGLVLYEVSDSVDQLKISSSHIWLHFNEPKNLNHVVSESSALIEEILDILQPTLYTRLGWRTYFAKHRSTRQAGTVATDDLTIRDRVGSFGIENLVLSRAMSGLTARIEVSPLTHKTDPKKTALMFDIDLGKDIKSREITNTLKEMQAKYKSEDLLKSLEALLND